MKATLATLNITNEGRRGRPALPVERESFALALFNSKDVEVGTVEFVPDGTSVKIVITPEGGKAKTVSLASPKARTAPAKAPKASAAPATA